MYEFIESRLHEDTLIYYFFEHGNKNAQNLRRTIGDRFKPRRNDFWNPWHRRTREGKIIIMHDQEPLFFDLYQNLNEEQLFTRWEDYSVPKLKKEYTKNSEWLTAMSSDRAFDIWCQYSRNLNLNALVRTDATICDLTMLCHSELNSPELDKYERSGFVGVYYWSHALICREWYRHATSDPFLDHRHNHYHKCFNIYNRAWTGSREYRLKFTDLLVRHNLDQHSNLKFSPYQDGIYYRDHQFKNQKFLLDNTLDHLDPNLSSSDSSAAYDKLDYGSHAIDVVLETLFDDPRVHLTEKTIRPIACGKPFILVAAAGSLDVLRNYGFDTFDDLINNSYDQVTDPLERLEAIVCEMKRISDLDTKQQKKLWNDLHVRAAENKKIFWSQDFADRITKEFDDNYQAAREKCLQHMTGKNWINFRKAMSKDPECRRVLTSDDARRTRQDLANLFLEIKNNQNTIR